MTRARIISYTTENKRPINVLEIPNYCSAPPYPELPYYVPLVEAETSRCLVQYIFNEHSLIDTLTCFT